MSRLNAFLSGIRIVDFSRHLPGPFATLFLADMGADVQCIEPPAGDDMRRAGPKTPEGRPVYFDALHAGKRTRRLDSRDAEQRFALLELLDGADVLVESFRPGVMDRLGLDYIFLSARNPQLIYCSLNGFGSTGEVSKAAARDANFLALSGLLDRNGTPERPVLPPATLADYAGSMTLLIAILGALVARQRDGRGARIEVALADTLMPLQLLEIAELAASGHRPKRGAELLTGAEARYNVYGTRDGRFVVLAALDDGAWQRFCAAAERPEWIDWPTDPSGRGELIALLERYFVTLSAAECEARFTPADCCLSVILTLPEALESAHHRGTGFVRATGSGLQTLLPATVDGEKPAHRPPVREE